MSLAGLHLVRLFSFYLAGIFVIGSLLRLQQYRAILGLVGSFPGRWPRLLRLVRQHSNLFLTWGTVLPGLLTLALLLVHTLASQWLLPGAELTAGQLATCLTMLIPVVLLGLAMVGFDVFMLTQSGAIDRAALEKHFDQAEYWLRSWTAPVVRVLSLGYVNPRRIVSNEVRKALESCSQLLNTTLWGMSLQTGLRIAFGLSLWCAWALLH